MRALTTEELQQLDRIRDRFPEIRSEMWPMLTDMFDKLGFAAPPPGVRPATWYLPALDQWMSSQTMSSDSFYWILARIAAFLGELLIERWDGTWFVNDLPDSRFFAKPVVGRFPGMANPDVMVDPYAAAFDFVSSSPGRSLSSVLSEIEQGLKANAQ